MRAIRVPEDMALDGTHLVWKTDSTVRRVEPGKRMLLDFIHLNDADDMGILKYAERWGVLQLCTHRLPSTHNLPPDFLTEAALKWCLPTGREPLDVWCQFARRAGLIVNVAAHLNQGKLFDPQQWIETVWEWDAPGERLPANQGIVWDYSGPPPSSAHGWRCSSTSGCGSRMCGPRCYGTEK